MTVRDIILARLAAAHPRGQSAMQLARPPGEQPLQLGPVERTLADLWAEEQVDGWPSGPWTLHRAPVEAQLRIGEAG